MNRWRRFNAMNGSAKGPRSASDMTALCSQQAGSFIDLPAQRIDTSGSADRATAERLR